MPLPIELIQEPEDTTVVGDIEAFMIYVETGQAARDYHERISFRLKELEDTLGR